MMIKLLVFCITAWIIFRFYRGHLEPAVKRALKLPEKRELLRQPGTAGRLVDQTHEQVRRSGPLKPHHRRMVIRDERLMPKPQKRHSLTRPPKVMNRDEAARLFSPSLRTTNRDLRTLATDEAQLARHGLPVWRSEEDVAKALHLTVKQLRHFSSHRPRERVPHYLVYSIKKRSGGLRTIHAPKKRLKAILRMLNQELVCKLPVSDCAHGFIRKRSVKTGAEPHVGQVVVLRMDIKDFFPSVTAARVRGLLVALGYSYPVAATLSVLMTECERQPVTLEGTTYHVPVGPRVCVQGAPTSPGLCNAIVARMDKRLAALAHRHGFIYTRYADDLTFSGPTLDGAHALRRSVARVVEEEGFCINQHKTRVMGRGGHQVVTGVTVNQVLGLSRKERRRIRAMAHQQRTTQATPEQLARLDGLLAWVHMLNPLQAQALRGVYKRG